MKRGSGQYSRPTFFFRRTVTKKPIARPFATIAVTVTTPAFASNDVAYERSPEAAGPCAARSGSAGTANRVGWTLWLM